MTPEDRIREAVTKAGHRTRLTNADWAENVRQAEDDARRAALREADNSRALRADHAMSAHPTREEIDRLRALGAEALGETWFAQRRESGQWAVVTPGANLLVAWGLRREEIDLVVEMRNALPRLLDAAEELKLARALLQRVRAEGFICGIETIEAVDEWLEDKR